MLNEEEIKKLIKSLNHSDDDARRLLRLYFVENRLFKRVIDLLNDGFIHLKDLDNVDVNNVNDLTEFLDGVSYNKEFIENPTYDDLKEFIDFNSLLKSIKINYDFLYKPLLNIESFILSIQIGKVDAINYKTEDEFNKDFNEFYRKLISNVPNIISTQLEDTKSIRDLIVRGSKEDTSHKVITEAVVNNLVDFYKDILTKFSTSADTFRDNYFNINNTDSNLLLYSNKSNFILNFSINNIYLTSFINEVLEAYVYYGKNTQKLIEDYLLVELTDINLVTSNNLYKDLTKMLIFSYILYKLDNRYNVTYIGTMNMINILTIFRESIVETFNLGNNLLITK